MQGERELSGERIWTHVSTKALNGMIRLFRERDIYIRPMCDGRWVVVTRPKLTRNV